MIQQWSVRLGGVALTLAATFAVAGQGQVQKGVAVPKGEAAQKGAAVQGPICGPVAPTVQYVTRTVMRPTYVTEKRTVCETQYKAETKTRTVQVCRQVPETSQVEQKYTTYDYVQKSREEQYQVTVPVYSTVKQSYEVRIPEWKQVERTYQVRVPVWSTVERDITVMVPHQEQRQGMRNVWVTVPVTVMKTVCRDNGHFENRVSTVCVAPVVRVHHGCGRRHCGGCATCVASCAPQTVTTCHRVWVPNIVTEQVAVTIQRCELKQQLCTYTATVCRPETRKQSVKVCNYETQTKTRMERVCEYRTETKTKDVKTCRYETQTKSRVVNYTECVPVQKTRKVNVTTYKTVVEERKEDYVVHTPVQVQREIDVTVCRLVPVQETVAVSACCTIGCGIGHRRIRLGGCGTCY